MFLRRNRHNVPQLNTTSTSDISFMLLIFFLVTTSMNSEKGLGRQLPPIDPEEQTELLDVDRSKVMTFHLEKGGKVMIEDTDTPADGGTVVKIDDTLRKRLRHFIIEKGNRHIIELKVDRDADYDTYFKLQNTIVRAYGELRNSAAKKRYGKPFANCNEDERQKVVDQFPQRIQESTQPEK